MVTFGEVARNVNINEKEPLKHGITRAVGLEHLDPCSLQITRWDEITDEISFTRRFSKGQILFGKRRAYQRKAALAEFDGICSSDILVFEAKPAVLIPELLPFVVQSDRFFEFAINTSSGSLSPRTKWKDLARQEFPLPPIDEQRRIAEILWAAEDVIVKNETFVAEMEHYKQLMMRDLFSKGIGHRDYRVVKTVGMAPTDWIIETLSDISSVKTGPFGAQLHQEDYVEYGTPIITVEHLGDNRIIHRDLPHVSEQDKHRLSQYVLTQGDIVFSRVGSVDRGCLITHNEEGWLFSGRLLRVRVNKTKILPRYLSYYFQREEFKVHIRRIAVGGIMPSINTTLLSSVFIPVPSIAEQRQIAAILSATDDTIAAARASVDASKALKMQMINEFLSFNGREGHGY